MSHAVLSLFLILCSRLSKLLVSMILHLANNEYTVLNFYNFVNLLSNIKNSNNYYMCSLDISSLYTKGPVRETIQIVLDKLFANNLQQYKGFNIRQF